MILISSLGRVAASAARSQHSSSQQTALCGKIW